MSFDTTSLIAYTDTLYFREEEKEFLVCDNDWSPDLADLVSTRRKAKQSLFVGWINNNMTRRRNCTN